MTRRRIVTAIAIVAGTALAAGACTPDPAPGPTPVPAPSPPGPHYMTDNIELSDITTANADSTSATVTVRTWGCTDADTCPGGSRTTSGYVWFAAVQVDVGPGADDPFTYGLHGGLAVGGSGGQAQLYADWSGYCPSSLGGRALRSGGTACATPSPNPTHKPHTVTNLVEGRPYRLTFGRVACSVSEVTDVSGPLSGWRMTVADTVTGTTYDAGTWCLPKASMIAHVSAFSELYEPVACTTDLRSVEFADLSYHDPTGTHAFGSAAGRYNGNDTSLDADCANTNLRSPAPGTVVDERMATRGSGGGLLTADQLW